MCHLGFADEVVLGQCDFVAWELVCLCVRVIVCGTHRKGTRADAHHLETNAIDSEGDRWVRQYLKVESDNTIAAVDVLQRIGIGAWMGIGIAIPGIALARADGCAYGF